ncbi:hypothetical protein [Phytomonospora endophytica]|uniref:Uncharacterized protein n=1 Tax=Phytomonospora endophytica TaxID=714109 RepID=A0A841FZ14_9ACTN|nr:hypothetical protein [Phytomonospora endophytica]MBB6038762.1 hypothetical protein [Phytomonospora endophytica]GIG68442.1 hypothetical protein Pen01_47370 [Phytomonospora endophytica]
MSTRRIELDPQLAWCRPGERLLTRAKPTGHIGSSVAGEVTAPHEPRSATPQPVDPAPPLPLPTASVAEGRFHDDEWVHDPTLWGWVHAESPDRLAVRLADPLTAGRGEVTLLLSTRRIAVARTHQPFTVWFEADVRHVTAVRPFGLLGGGGQREFLRADFADRSVLLWQVNRVRKEARDVRTALGL